MISCLPNFLISPSVRREGDAAWPARVAVKQNMKIELPEEIFGVKKRM